MAKYPPLFIILNVMAAVLNSQDIYQIICSHYFMTICINIHFQLNSQIHFVEFNDEFRAVYLH